MEQAKQVGKWLLANWERVFFVAVGLAFLTSSFRLVHNDKVTEAAVVFGLSFLCFLYANVARFKRFKGLGFEAELWEDKQREAEDLIDRLKGMVGIYTHEIVMNRVTAMRFSANDGWFGHWALYNELTSQHDKLGQKIDFSYLKKRMDDFFLYDATQLPLEDLDSYVRSAIGQAEAHIRLEFKYRERDDLAYARRADQLGEALFDVAEYYNIFQTGNVAKAALDGYANSQSKLMEHFNVEINVPAKLLDRLHELSDLYETRPVEITAQRITWAGEASWRDN